MMAKIKNKFDKFAHICCSLHNSILDILRQIEINKEGFVFLVDKNNALVQVITDGDIRRLLIQHNGDINLNTPCLQFMQNKNIPVCIDENTFEFSTLSLLFMQDKIAVLPIINKQKQLVNYITKSEFHSAVLHNSLKGSNYNYRLLKKYKKELDIYARPWGFYKSVLLTKILQSKIIVIFPLQAISLQKHRHREEHWIIVYGKGNVVLEDTQMQVYPGKYIFIPKGCKHRILNISSKNNLVFFELQRGNYFGEDDIIRYEDKYNRS